MDKWNPWKVTALAMAMVMATALVTGLVVANWSDTGREVAQPTPSPTNTRLIQQPGAASVKPAASQTQAVPAPSTPAVPAVPTQDVVDACNRYAAAQVGETDKTKEAVAGAAVGAAGGAIAGGGKGAGKGAAIGGVVGAGGGTLYGLNENKKNYEK